MRTIMYCPSCVVSYNFSERSDEDGDLFLSGIKGGFKDPVHLKNLKLKCLNCGVFLEGEMLRGRRHSFLRGAGQHELEVVTIAKFPGEYFWMRSLIRNTIAAPGKSVRERIEEGKHPDYDKYHTW